MGKPTGFMEIARVENPYRDEATRLRDFEDLHIASIQHAHATYQPSISKE